MRDFQWVLISDYIGEEMIAELDGIPFEELINDKEKFETLKAFLLERRNEFGETKGVPNVFWYYIDGALAMVELLSDVFEEEKEAMAESMEVEPPESEDPQRIGKHFGGHVGQEEPLPTASTRFTNPYVDEQFAKGHPKHGNTIVFNTPSEPENVNTNEPIDEDIEQRDDGYESTIEEDKEPLKTSIEDLDSNNKVYFNRQDVSIGLGRLEIEEGQLVLVFDKFYLKDDNTGDVVVRDVVDGNIQGYKVLDMTFEDALEVMKSK